MDPAVERWRSAEMHAADLGQQIIGRSGGVI
jgi:hypothetical protein